ncbi:hypothetical protein G9F71_002220 [Clostridium sp. FP2]|uniref:hypothetical protein n=1 Tax=Clostridium sp. FP2 TaxID=2724481 RepID=UPI0013E97B0E|nr:hypothetical protein [Clostridium sp. FP2]MBZ9621683.1 hypothetical protein [Clostridium sp. FP2]
MNDLVSLTNEELIEVTGGRARMPISDFRNGPIMAPRAIAKIASDFLKSAWDSRGTGSGGLYNNSIGKY